MPRSMTMPTKPATRKASGSAIASDQSNSQGAGPRIDLLDDEGRVGAEHDHFAVGHVDDAHDAEGDGKADGGEQQDGAKRQAVPGVLHDAPEGELALDRRRWRCRRRVQRRRQTSPDSDVSRRERVLAAAVADDGDGVDQVGLRRAALAERAQRRGPASSAA